MKVHLLRFPTNTMRIFHFNQDFVANVNSNLIFLFTNTLQIIFLRSSQICIEHMVNLFLEKIFYFQQKKTLVQNQKDMVNLQNKLQAFDVCRT
jgi:hypothetical protein